MVWGWSRLRCPTRFWGLEWVLRRLSRWIFRRLWLWRLWRSRRIWLWGLRVWFRGTLRSLLAKRWVWVL